MTDLGLCFIKSGLVKEWPFFSVVKLQIQVGLDGKKLSFSCFSTLADTDSEDAKMVTIWWILVIQGFGNWIVFTSL